MQILLHIVTYASILVFIVAVLLRFLRIRNYPVNLRWEIQPIPHEGARSKHGGTKMEETDWWTKEHKPDHVAEIKFMIPEMLFLKALYEHNRKLWLRSFPFHFGLYILAGFIALLVLGAVVNLILADNFVGKDQGGLLALLAYVTAAAGFVGLLLALAGTVGLLHARLTDIDMRPNTNPSHIINLLLFLVVLTVALVALLATPGRFFELRAYIESILTFDIGKANAVPLLNLTILLASLLIAYVPLTHMSHFFVKWFTWHKIRWDDEANVKGGRIEKMIQQALQYPVSWKADHIRGDGKKTWDDVATEEIEEK